MKRSTDIQSSRQATLRAVIFHLVAWVLIIWFIGSETFNLEWGPFQRSRGPIWVPVIYGTALGAAIFYINTLWLIPLFFGQSNKLRYWILAILLLVSISAVEALIDMLYIESFESSEAMTRFNLLPRYNSWVVFFELFLIGFTGNLFCWVLAFAYRLPQDWLKSERQKRELEHDKLKSELNFLKAQINPHFLFNGINSIYHMIDAENRMARDTLHQFSGLLRYQLYECNEKFISLDKELHYIKNYLAIESIRKGEDAFIKADVTGAAQSIAHKKLKIAPLLITPFLENSFKFLSNHSNPKHNFLDFSLSIDENGVLEMYLVNSYDKTYLPDKKAGGIGLENVRRRLAILYPEEKHHLTLSQGTKTYTVNLTIVLNED